MSIKKKIVSGLVLGSVVLTSFTPSFADAGFNAVSINNNSLSGTTTEVAKANGKNVENVYILNADQLIDGIPGGVLAGENNGAIVFVENGYLSEESLNLIYSAQNVYAIGGENIIPESMLANFSNYKGRISGDNRYETAVEIASKMNSNRDIIITNGESYADSLAATSLAVKNNSNIILTSANNVPEATREYLEANKGADVLFVGGDSSLSKKVKEEVSNLTNNDVNKIDENTVAGINRFDTSAELLNRFGDFESLIISNGTDYKDSILASSLGAKIGAPVLLVDNQNISAKVSSLSNINEVYSVSTGNISDLYLKNFIRTVLNDENVELPIKDMNGNVVNNINKGTVRTGWTIDSLNIRTSPSVQSASIGHLDKGYKINGIEEDGWIKVVYNGQKGYISSEFISDTEIKIEQPVVKEPVVEEPVEEEQSNNTVAPSTDNWHRANRRMVESSNNYYIGSANGYIGAYQFAPGTWNSIAASIGANPNDYSPANQDRIADAYANSRYGGWQNVPTSGGW